MNCNGIFFYCLCQFFSRNYSIYIASSAKKQIVTKPLLLYRPYAGLSNVTRLEQKLWDTALKDSSWLLRPVRKRTKNVCQQVSVQLTESVMWCLRTYIGLRPYMVNVYIKERINVQITICAGGGGHQ